MEGSRAGKGTKQMTLDLAIILWSLLGVIVLVSGFLTGEWRDFYARVVAEIREIRPVNFKSPGEGAEYK